MHIPVHFHTHRYHWTEMRELFASLTIQAFGISIIKIFIPIYLLTIGFAFQEVALIHMIWGLLSIPLHVLSMYLIPRLGVKHGLALGYIFSIIAFVLLNATQDNKDMLVPSFILLALAEVFYWNSRHVESSYVIAKSKTGRNVSVAMVLTFIAAVLGPVFGGLVGQKFGLDAVLFVASAIIFIAIFPLFLSKELRIPKNLTKSKKIPVTQFIANFSFNADHKVGGGIWPVFVYLLLDSVSSVGILFSVGIIATVFITLIVGPLSDKGYKKLFIVVCGLIRSLVNVSRVTVSSMPAAYAVNTAGEIGSATGLSPYGAAFYEGARKYGIYNYILKMELFSYSATAITWGIAFIATLFTTTTNAMFISFFFAAACSPLIVFITKGTKTKVL
jgi:MFS family permease